jgi:hypothetical protein
MNTTGKITMYAIVAMKNVKMPTNVLLIYAMPLALKNSRLFHFPPRALRSQTLER